jgi:vesicle coat complex subunit
MRFKPSLAGNDLELISTLVSDSDNDVRKYALLALAEIVKSDPNLASLGLFLIDNLLYNSSNDLKKTLT